MTSPPGMVAGDNRPEVGRSSRVSPAGPHVWGAAVASCRGTGAMPRLKRRHLGANAPSTMLMVSPISGTHDMARIKQQAGDINGRIALAQARIEAAVAAIQSGPEWHAYLKLQSSLHRYSTGNVWLIASQHAAAFEQGSVDTPWPTYVAGFNTWKALGRSVAKGQRGYQILAPNRTPARVATDAAGRSRILGGDEAPSHGESLETTRIVKGFRIEHVYSAEQTTGNLLPEPPTPKLLAGTAPDRLWDNIIGQITDRGFAVRLVASADVIGGANGRTTWDSRLVEVRSDMDESARAKTLIHELGHVLLHAPNSFEGNVHPPRGLMEVEAESVAFIVADAHGMTADGYTFPYVSAWAGQDGTKAVRATASRVASAARSIIEASTAAHGTGGRVPGVEAALQARRRAAQPLTPSRVLQEPEQRGIGGAA
jgi:N-terminal domain of anti-restriction factor ArdC